MNNPQSSIAALTAICLSLLLAACLPTRFLIDLAPSDGKLHESTVLTDTGASRGSPKIALIDITGLISNAPEPGLFAGGGNSVDRLVSQLKKATDDPRVKAVILRVDSPGGTVAASKTMYQEIRRFREQTSKPVVVSMSELAASGGYYISLAADHIIAQSTTITGSIGVIIQTVNFSKGMQMIGITARAVKSGPMKDIANPLEPIRDEQYAILQSTVDDFYDSFVSLVKNRRGAALNQSELTTLTDGRVFTGRQALKHGLVDELGSLRDAFDSAKSLADISAARLVKYHVEGRVPMSPYAASLPLPSPAAQAPGRQVNIMQLNLPQGFTPSAGFYYLWSPTLP